MDRELDETVTAVAALKAAYDHFFRRPNPRAQRWSECAAAHERLLVLLSSPEVQGALDSRIVPIIKSGGAAPEEALETILDMDSPAELVEFKLGSRLGFTERELRGGFAASRDQLRRVLRRDERLEPITSTNDLASELHRLLEETERVFQSTAGKRLGRTLKDRLRREQHQTAHRCLLRVGGVVVNATSPGYFGYSYALSVGMGRPLPA